MADAQQDWQDRASAMFERAFPERKFKVGDRVTYKCTWTGHRLEGFAGVVVDGGRSCYTHVDFGAAAEDLDVHARSFPCLEKELTLLPELPQSKREAREMIKQFRPGDKLRCKRDGLTITVRSVEGASVYYVWDDDTSCVVCRPLHQFVGWFEPIPPLPQSKREAREMIEQSRARDKEPAPAKTEAQIRKDRPLARGVLWYFPDALMAVAELSRVGNEQHNAGQPMHWAYGKSTDEADCILRHLVDAGTLDTDGMPHSAKVAWRALALLQRELESADPELHARRQEARDRAAAGK